MKKINTLAVMAAAATALAASPALAHAGHGAHAVFSGLAHPFAGADHLIAMLAVGLWAATRGQGRGWQAPATFLAFLFAGGVLGIVTGGIAMVEPLIGVSLLGLSVMLLAAPFVPDRIGLPLIGMFALLHGHAHGAEAVGAVPVFFAGFIAASALLHLIGWKLGSAISVSPAGRALAAMSVGAVGLAVLAG